MRVRLTLVLSAVITAAPASAQANPEDVVRAFFRAEDEGRWFDAARMLDLRRFERFRQSVVHGYRTRPPIAERTPEELMKWQPDIPRAVAEYQAKQMNESLRRYNPLERDFARTNSVDTLAALTTEEAAARWLEAMGPEWKNALAIKESAGRPTVDCPGLSDSAKKALLAKEFGNPTARILGSTASSDSLRYVVIGEVFRILSGGSAGQFDNEPAISPTTITLRSVSGLWKIVPMHDMPQSSGVHGSISFAISCARDSALKASLRK